jgi:hypothetical protein
MALLRQYNSSDNSSGEGIFKGLVHNFTVVVCPGSKH